MASSPGVFALLLCILISLQITCNANKDNYVRVCYYTNWSQYRAEHGKFFPEDVDPFLCSHLVYAFANMADGALTLLEWNDEDMYGRFNALKEKNPSLKTLLAVGGWNFRLDLMTSMLNTVDSRQHFVTTSIAFLRKYGFDGLDLDFEYPGNRGSPAGDKFKFTMLVHELRIGFNAEVVPAGKSRLLLTSAVGVGKKTVESAYEVEAIAKNLDLILLMTFDLRGSWDGKTGINAPLHKRQSEAGDEAFLNVAWAAENWLEHGAPAEKLVLGLPMYGRTFTLSTSDSGIGAPTSGPGVKGVCTGEAGFVSYYEICPLVKSGAAVFREPEQKVPYLVDGDQWIGYDDATSLREKVEWMMAANFAGIMVWELSLDDFKDVCLSGKYPLLTAINDALDGGEPAGDNSIPNPTNNGGGQVTGGQGKRSDDYVCVCYYTNWGQYRAEPANFVPENIDATLCSHIVYAFADMVDGELMPLEWNDIDMYGRVNALKDNNPSLKTLLAIGGWNFDLVAMTTMLSTYDTRKHFVTTSIAYLRMHGFDGLDLDFEYPGNRGSPADDKFKYTLLLQELRAGFATEAASSGKPRLLLTAAVGVTKYVVDTAYEVAAIGESLDLIFLMSFDFHGSWDKKTGMNAPLYKRQIDTGDAALFNVAAAAEYWVELGAPANKLVVGMPLYGRTYTLATSQSGLGALAVGPGDAGVFTGEPGFISYYEVCPMLDSDDVTVYRDEEQRTPYLVDGDQWISYDDTTSLTEKVDWMRAAGFAGVMVWELSMDDFMNACGAGLYPLLRSINHALSVSPSSPNIPNIPNKPEDETPAPTTVAPPPPVDVRRIILRTGYYLRVCFFTNSAQYRLGAAQFMPEDIQADMCTHLVYGYATIEGGVLAPLEWNDDLRDGMYEKFNAIKQTKRSLKTLLSVGGWNFQLSRMTQMLATAENRTKFVQSVMPFLREWNFNGLDLAFEYPGKRGSPAEDKHRFTLLVRELREAFDHEYRLRRVARLLLTATVGVTNDVVEDAYEVPDIARSLHWIHLNTFDLHGSWDWKLGHHTALHPRDSDPVGASDNVAAAATNWVTLGAPSKKLVLGLAFYGRSFQMAEDDPSLGAAISGPGLAGSYTSERGFMSYYEICMKINEGATVIRDTEQMVPHLIDDEKKQWIGYDDPDSIKEKVRWMKIHRFAGVAAKSLDLDDFGDLCGHGRYPLLNAMLDGIRSRVFINFP